MLKLRTSKNSGVDTENPGKTGESAWESNPYILNYSGLRVVDIRRREVIDITISTVRTVKVWHYIRGTICLLS